jgi:hypothetical protein
MKNTTMKMNKLTSISLISAFVLSASTASAATATFGNWSSVSGFTEGSVSTFDFVTIQDGLTFTLTATTATDPYLVIGNANAALMPAASAKDNSWDQNESMTLSLNVTGGTLDSLAFDNLGLNRANNPDDLMSFTDQSANTITGYGATGGGLGGTFDATDVTAAELATGGLTALTKDNFGSWSLTIVSLTNGTMAGMDDITFEYTTTAVPEPGTYALLAGCAALGFVMLRRRR